MPQFEIKGKKEAFFKTIVEAENATQAINIVANNIDSFVWLPEEQNSTSNDIYVTGVPKKLEEV